MRILTTGANLMFPKLKLIGVVGLFLMLSTIAISTYGLSASSNQVQTSQGCDMKTLMAHVIAAGQMVTSQEAIDFAVASPQYKQLSAGSNTTYTGSNDGWSYDSNCAVSWTGIAVNFLLTSANGSKYILTVSENPRIGVVDWARVSPAVSEQISPSCYPQYTYCGWSGYAIAGNSEASQQVYESDARWYIPQLEEPGGQVTCTSSFECDLSEWVGLTDQATQTQSTATIVQAGIFSTIYPNVNPPPNDYTIYEGWTEVYCQGYSDTWCQSSIQVCPNMLSLNGEVNPNDQMESTEENQLPYTGYAGNGYYIFLNDWTTSELCDAQPNGNPVSIGDSQHPFTPTYAAFMAEHNNPASYHLAGFPDWYYTDCAFNPGGLTGDYQGVYSYYSGGDGYGVYMYQNGWTQTTTDAMTQVGNGYGQFTIHWDTSNGS